MKKIMIMAVASAMVFAANAYDVKWGALNVRMPVASDVTKDQTGIKVTTSSTQFDANALTMSLFWVDNTGSEITYEGWTASNNSKGALSAFALFDNTSDAYKAIVADAGTSSGTAVDFVMHATYTTKDGVYTFSQTLANKDITGLDTGNVTLNFGMTNGSWDYKANAVPEPTSGLLLLLGVAGLALRRRRA